MNIQFTVNVKEESVTLYPLGIVVSKEFLLCAGDPIPMLKEYMNEKVRLHKKHKQKDLSKHALLTLESAKAALKDLKERPDLWNNQKQQQ